MDIDGVLNDELLGQAVERRQLDAGEFRIPGRNIQPASVDLTLGETAHRLRSSFLPDRESVETKLKDLSQGIVDLHRGGFLEHRVPYLIELRERLDLPSSLRGKANPKSSTGRLDVFTRIITDHSYQFDEVRAGYSGRLYLEVVPISFPIKVREGLSLNQLRLIARSASRLTDDDIRAAHGMTPLLYQEGEPVPDSRLAVSSGLFVSVDLKGNEDGVVGYKARSHTRLLDLTTADQIDPRDFWEPVRRERGDRIVLEPEVFYLLLSQEGVSIPPNLAGEMVAYDPTSGELRTHYAGFFDPGFGFGDGVAGRTQGSRAALEVRAHDVPFMIEHGQSVCKLSFERMTRPPAHLYGTLESSHYQNQATTLSKYFLGHPGRLSPLPDWH